MKILALDTTTRFLCVGIYKEGACYEYVVEAGRKMSLLITPTLSRLLDAAGLDLERIDYIACGLGPGSFTGIRLGLSTVKGLTFLSPIVTVGIPTLEIIASSAVGAKGPIAVLVDAKRSLLYYGLFIFSGQTLKRLQPDQLLTFEQVCKKIKGPVAIAGDGAGLYRDAIARKLPQAVILDKDCWHPRGNAMIRLALERIEKNKISKQCAPIYLYPKECQVRGRNVAGK
jgi:tRNA threonylcarbamoyladenosine biosynthesis protein TsaB